MKVIIQCAASKHHDAGKLRTRSGEEVLFVASPALCHSVRSGTRFARPDDSCGEETITWRDVLNRYNNQGENPYNLFRAADLYAPNEHEFRSVYRDLATTFGWENVFVLSAGWGLIRADFRTPDYNVTFSAPAKKEKPWAWRNPKRDALRWLDFNHLLNAEIARDEPVHFFGGKDYRHALYALSESVPGKKIVHYKSTDVERRSGFDYAKYDGPEKNRTWHYRAAKEFAEQHRGAGQGS